MRRPGEFEYKAERLLAISIAKRMSSGLQSRAGIVSKTGIGGLTLGGGVGWLIRKYGMTIDNLLSAQVVTADGKVLTASASENDDLFWALRGGGGNFGVVTSFEFQAHPVATVLGGLLLYPRAMAVDVIRHFRDYMASAPDELTAYAALLHGPDGSPLVGVIPCYCGDVAEGERVLQPLRKFGSPIVDGIQAMPFPAMQSLLGPSFPDGNQNYWKSTLQRELSDDAISAIVEHANRLLSPLSFVVLEYYGGAAGRVSSEATAFPHRNLPWDILFLAQWTDPAQTNMHRDWARSGEEILRPFSENAHLLSALDVEARRRHQDSIRSELATPGRHQEEIRSHQFLPRESQYQSWSTDDRLRVLKQAVMKFIRSCWPPFEPR